MYIHERDNWTNFRWDNEKISLLLENVNRRQGMLFGHLASLGFDNRLMAMAENLTHDVLYSSEIEGIQLNMDQVRSSIAFRLGIENIKYSTSSRYIDSVVSVMLDAIEHYDKELTKEKLCAWQSAFFPMGMSGGETIVVGQYRTGEEKIVSGMFGREKVHYVAPCAERVNEEMERFLTWFNSDISDSTVVRSAIAHFWFVAIHPFEDGNGRLARILSDMMLARGDKSQYRFYNISSQINKEKKRYYNILEQTTSGDGDLTEWIVWYIETLQKALDEAERSIRSILSKSLFWQRVSGVSLTERQTRILNIFLDGYESKITTKTWSALAKCSKDTAIRDIQDLVDKGILSIDIAGAKRPSYSIVYEEEDITADFKNIKVIEEDSNYFLTATYKGKTAIREELQRLDAQRYAKGDLPLRSLLGKYCGYLRI